MKKLYTFEQFQKDNQLDDQYLLVKWNIPKERELFEAISPNYWEDINKRARSKKYRDAVRAFLG